MINKPIRKDEQMKILFGTTYHKLGFSVYDTAEDDYGKFYRMEKKL